MFGLGMNFGAGAQVEIAQGISQSIQLDIGQTGSVQIPAVDSAGDPLSFTGKTLQFVATDYRGAEVLSVADGSIARSSGTFTVGLNVATTAKKRTLRWRLLDVTGGGEAELLQGWFPVY